jgi:hypothetical protein
MAVFQHHTPPILTPAATSLRDGTGQDNWRPQGGCMYVSQCGGWRCAAPAAAVMAFVWQQRQCAVCSLIVLVYCCAKCFPGEQTSHGRLWASACDRPVESARVHGRRQGARALPCTWFARGRRWCWWPLHTRFLGRNSSWYGDDRGSLRGPLFKSAHCPMGFCRQGCWPRPLYNSFRR